MDYIKIQTPATSANLGAGFDCLGLALDFCSTVEIQRSGQFSIQIYGEGANNPRIRANNMFLSIFEEQYRKINNDQMDTFKFIFNNF